MLGKVSVFKSISAVWMTFPLNKLPCVDSTSPYPRPVNQTRVRLKFPAKEHGPSWSSDYT